jgi:hypothetical protein
MIVTVYDWNRCLQKEMERDGLKHGQEVDMAAERVVKLSESYDVLIRTAVNLEVRQPSVPLRPHERAPPH